MEYLQYLYNSFVSFSNSVVSVLSYIWSILQSMWYGATTLMTWIFDLVNQIFTSWLF